MKPSGRCSRVGQLTSSGRSGSPPNLDRPTGMLESSAGEVLTRTHGLAARLIASATRPKPSVSAISRIFERVSMVWLLNLKGRPTTSRRKLLLADAAEFALRLLADPLLRLHGGESNVAESKALQRLGKLLGTEHCGR